MDVRFPRSLKLVAVIALVGLLTPVVQAQVQNRGVTITAEDMARAQEAYKLQQMRDAIAQDKSAFVAGLMSRWASDIVDEKGYNGFQAAFMNADADKLMAISQASTFEAVKMLLMGFNPIIGKTIGSEVNDLVFTPLTPCRVLDTRFGSGQWL